MNKKYVIRFKVKLEAVNIPTEEVLYQLSSAMEKNIMVRKDGRSIALQLTDLRGNIINTPSENHEAPRITVTDVFMDGWDESNENF